MLLYVGIILKNVDFDKWSEQSLEELMRRLEAHQKILDTYFDSPPDYDNIDLGKTSISQIVLEERLKRRRYPSSLPKNSGISGLIASIKWKFMRNRLIKEFEDEINIFLNFKEALIEIIKDRKNKHQL